MTYPPALLVTIDVEIAQDRNLDAQTDALWRLGSEFAQFPATWFCTAEAAECFAEPLRALVQKGHTIGCHGLNHGCWEDYHQLSTAYALQTLAEATQRIEKALGMRPRIFRGPRMTTSAATQAALRKLDYWADFSICARRFDFLIASRFDYHWLTVKPTPYCPAPEHPFCAVGQPIAGELIVVPLSGLGIPLISGSLYLLGQKPMLVMAKAMLKQATQAGAPIVYLFHSYEFVDVGKSIDHRPFHQRFYPAAEKRYKANLDFLGRLRVDLGLNPLSADQYLSTITHET